EPGAVETDTAEPDSAETDSAETDAAELGADGGGELTAEGLVVPIELTAGEVTDIPFDGLADGSYTITIESTVPVVAAARSSLVAESAGDGDDGATDFAWFGTASPLAATALVSVAPGPGSVLHLVNTTPSPVRADIHAGIGASTVADVPAGGAVAVPVTAGGNYTITGFDTLYLAVSYAGDGALAGFTVTGPLPIASAVTVYY
ncbi:MAG TPA: DUF5719 family protein, partial [Terrimesophilobacter sp.]|nr:DUF5719 family protein [Terrimesophilobacter sp.]